MGWIVPSQDSTPEDPSLRALQSLQRRLAEHPLADAGWDLPLVRRFMEHHVVCVLDFMSLVKRLQRELTVTSHPWTPPRDPACARFINEIVLDEESDAAFGDEALSHYEWYLRAMQEVGADTTPIHGFERLLGTGMRPVEALAESTLPREAKAFASLTYGAAEDELHVCAGVFLYGREQIIPRIFAPLSAALRGADISADTLVRYMERHIDVDGESHGPLAERLFEHACGGFEHAAVTHPPFTTLWSAPELGL